MSTVSLESVRVLLANAKRRPAERMSPADFSPALRTCLLVLQPTPFCNLDCRYCYLPSRSLARQMDIGVVRAAVRRLVEDGLVGDTLSIVWHAGEPLAAPVSFYRASFDAIRAELGTTVRVRHAMQTNATLINDTWCELFREFEVDIGVSVDGPAAMHDAYRQTRGGKGTHASVMRGIDVLRRQQIPFHVIAVITDCSVDDCDSVFTFFSSIGARELCLNFDEAEGPWATSSLAGREVAWQRFIERMLALTWRAGGTTGVREFDQARAAICRDSRAVWFEGRAWPDNAQILPFAITSVAWNGDFCTFSPELLGQPDCDHANFVFGNVLRESYLDSTTGEPFQKTFRAILAGVGICRATCEHYRYCGGGAPGNKLFENGSFATGETLYCRNAIKRPFDAVLARLEADLLPTPAPPTQRPER